MWIYTSTPPYAFMAWYLIKHRDNFAFLWRKYLYQLLRNPKSHLHPKPFNFHFCMPSTPAVGFTQPPIQWLPGVKRPGHDADHSSPPNTEVKKMWIYTSTPPYAFMALCLIR
jgi:hypothetical protein